MPKLVNNLPILNRVLAHWTQVEENIVTTVALPDGTHHSQAQSLATRIREVEVSLMEGRNALSVAQADRNQARSAVYTAAKQARKSLRGLAQNAPDVQGLPDVPPGTSASPVLLAAGEDIANVWLRVNGLPQASVPAAHLPLRIPLTENNALVQLSQEQFVQHLERLRTVAEALEEAEASVTVGIGARDALHDQAAELVKRYATVVRGLLPEGHPLLKTVPKLTGS